MNTRNDNRFANLSLIGITLVGIAGIGAGVAYVGAPIPEPVPASHVVEVTPTPQTYTVPSIERPATYEACATEDEVPTLAPCYWDAATQGNGEGRSFIAFPDGSVEYDELDTARDDL